MREDELIERLEMFRDDARLIMTRYEVQQHIDLLSRLKAENEKLGTIVKNNSIHKQETVEQWEERTGEKYPSDAPVWFYGNDNNYHLDEYLDVAWLDRSAHPLIVANHHGKPTIDYPLD